MRYTLKSQEEVIEQYLAGKMTHAKCRKVSFAGDLLFSNNYSLAKKFSIAERNLLLVNRTNADDKYAVNNQRNGTIRQITTVATQ